MRTLTRISLCLALFVFSAPVWALQLTSPSFTAGGSLPVDFTCDGTRQSPPLAWSGAPAGTKFFAITMHHIPGPGDKHVYWVEYGIPATQSSVTIGAHTGGTWGLNTVNSAAEYTPPCSKGPGVKEYIFTVYALSAAPTLSKAAPTMDELLKGMEGKTLATATLSVTYERTGAEGSANAEGPGPGPDAETRDGPPPADLLHVPVPFLTSELKLTAAQATSVQTALTSLRGKQAEDAIAKVFTDAQRAQVPALLAFLTQLQSLGIPPEALGDLTFTADQKTKLAAATRETVEGILTDAQKKVIDAAKAKGPGPKAP